MKKRINETKVRSNAHEQELQTLYVFEKINELIDNINSEDIIAFFSHRFNQDIKKKDIKFLELRIKDSLRQFNSRNQRIIEKYGYTVNEE